MIKLKRRKKNLETPCVRRKRDGGGAQLNKLVIELIKYTQYVVILFETSEHF